MYSTGNPCHSAVLVSTTVSSTGLAVVVMRTPSVWERVPPRRGTQPTRVDDRRARSPTRQFPDRERGHDGRGAGGDAELGVDVLEVGVPLFGEMPSRRPMATLVSPSATRSRTAR